MSPSSEMPEKKIKQNLNYVMDVVQLQFFVEALKILNKLS
jgi:hypothetical protein